MQLGRIETFPIIELDYTNYRGERKTYEIFNTHHFTGESPYHREAGVAMFLHARKLPNAESRDFLVKDIHSLKITDRVITVKYDIVEISTKKEVDDNLSFPFMNTGKDVAA